MNFFALSQAAPPVFIRNASIIPDAVTPIRKAPAATGPRRKPTTTGAAKETSPGTIISF
jgi:hypothetical protein